MLPAMDRKLYNSDRAEAEWIQARIQAREQAYAPIKYDFHDDFIV
jgi:hypothetical protein